MDGDTQSARDPMLHERLSRLRDALVEGLVERDVAVRLALLSMLAGEHLLLIGPPGTAKSLIARRLQLALADAVCFERLLTRFTVPEELFGPLSIRGLEEDRYERLTKGYLPAASIAFLDEIFKANSAILNALLTLLNERAFDNGTSRTQVPLAAVIGASNELPEGAELDALFDRFLLRLHVGPVSEEAFVQLLGIRGEVVPEVPMELRLTEQDLAAVHAGASRVTVPDDVVALLSALRQWCLAEGIFVSDRRWRKVVKLLQVSALTNGRERVSVWDCWLLQHCLWNEPEEREKVYGWYEERVGASSAMDPSRLTRIVVSWEQRLEADRASRTQMRDEKGRPLFGSKGEMTTATHAPRPLSNDAGKPLYLAPSDAVTRNGVQIQDRANGGGGYSVADLDSLLIRHGRGKEWFSEWDHHDAYLVDENNRLMRDVELPPILEPTRHKSEYIEACLIQLEAVLADVAEYHASLIAHIESMDMEIHDHLWVDSDFAAPASVSLERTLHEVDGLSARVAKLNRGFEMLPKETLPGEPTERHAAEDQTAEHPAVSLVTRRSARGRTR